MLLGPGSGGLRPSACGAESPAETAKEFHSTARPLTALKWRPNIVAAAFGPLEAQPHNPETFEELEVRKE